MSDPPVRRDGRCARCGGERRPPSASASRLYVDAGHYELDPFCSTGCARAWHGVEDAGSQIGDRVGPARRCKGCGGRLEDVTAKCVHCRKRASTRGAAARQAAA